MKALCQFTQNQIFPLIAGDVVQDPDESCRIKPAGSREGLNGTTKWLDATQKPSAPHSFHRLFEHRLGRVCRNEAPLRLQRAHTEKFLPSASGSGDQNMLRFGTKRR